MLMENDFLQSLRSFDKDHIPVPVVQKIKPYIANPEFEANKILTVRMHLFCISLCCIVCLCLSCVASLHPLLHSSCNCRCHLLEQITCMHSKHFLLVTVAKKKIAYLCSSAASAFQAR